jgi:hypothetical protein
MLKEKEDKSKQQKRFVGVAYPTKTASNQKTENSPIKIAGSGL